MEIVTKNTDVSSVDFKEGALILVDKPLEWSSFSVVNKIRWILRHHYGLKKFKVGHSGTLDPLATGLLLIFCGKATKQINDHMGMDKSYVCTAKLGATTASYDAETPEENITDVDHITQEKVQKGLKEFEGEILQKAPLYSALKLNGQPMYKLARKGIAIEQKVRKIKIDAIQMTNFELPFTSFDVSCSKGTYIRSIAHDLGQNLGVGAYLSQLERTRIGSFRLSDAVSIQDFEQKMKEL